MKIHRARELLTCIGVATAVLLTFSSVPASASDVPTLANEMAKIAQSQAAHESEILLAHELSDPALAAYASDLMTLGGSSLSNYQRDLLKVVIDSAQYKDLFTPLLSGTPLSASQARELAAFRQNLHNNPAIQLLTSQGAQLKEDPAALSADISAVVNSDLGPASFTGPTGDPAMDAGLRAVATLPGSTAYGALAASVNTVLRDPGATGYVASLQPLVAASFIPGSQSVHFLLPNDRDPALFDVIIGGLAIIAGVAGFISVIALAPEVLAGAALVGVIAGLVAADATILGGIVTIYHAYDCDLDGDPSDPADVPGNEC